MRIFAQLERHEKAALQALQHLKENPTEGARALFEVVSVLERGRTSRKKERARILRSIVARFPHTD